MNRETKNNEIIEPPYRDVYHALATAYALENLVIMRISSALRDLRSEGLSRPYTHMTPWDRHAQAVIVLAYVRVFCAQPQIIECKYRRVHTQTDLLRKIHACLTMAQRSEYGYNLGTLLATAQWGGLRLTPAWIREFAPVIGKSKRTLWYMRNKIYNELDGKLDHSIARLEEPMREHGLIL